MHHSLIIDSSSGRYPQRMSACSHSIQSILTVPNPSSTMVMTDSDEQRLLHDSITKPFEVRIIQHTHKSTGSGLSLSAGHGCAREVVSATS